MRTNDETDAFVNVHLQRVWFIQKVYKHASCFHKKRLEMYSSKIGQRWFFSIEFPVMYCIAKRHINFKLSINLSLLSFQTL